MWSRFPNWLRKWTAETKRVGPWPEGYGIPMEVTDWQFPMRCPKCHATLGYPFYVTTEVLITADVRCHSCDHVWVVSAARPATVVRRKKDRRRTSPSRSR